MRYFEEVKIPSVSFIYNGKKVVDFETGWSKSVAQEECAGGSITRTAYLETRTQLRVTVHVRTFKMFDAIDWFVEFETNMSNTDTKENENPPISPFVKGGFTSPIIEEIMPLDITVPAISEEKVLLHHANGSACRMDDFLPLVSELAPNNCKTLSCVGGRSSNITLPFMNVQFGKKGMVVAIGWSGQWKAEFNRGNDNIRISAGMEKTRIRLHGGEKIRTPRILLLPWDGNDAERANNLLRQLLIAHYIPRIDGEVVEPPSAHCLQWQYYLTGKACEEWEMTALPKSAELGVEVYWIDACWYGETGDWWQEVGSWVVNKEKFPNGLKPISDNAHKHGMKFLLWFEPERVRLNSILHKEHPEWLISIENNKDNLLYNLGIPEARKYLTDLISRHIVEDGIDIYRQDFNFDPLPYWEKADSPDRVGITEIRYIEGLYAMWDELIKRHPGLWIDNCSSGGRRIDIETVSRSLPLWPSDFPDVGGLSFGPGSNVGDQCINAGLARWVPLFGGGVWNFTPYGTRGEIIGGFTFGFHIERKDFPPDDSNRYVGFKEVLEKGKTLLDNDFPMGEAKKAIEEWKSVRKYFLGDFYLLQPLTVSYYDWCAWQFHREDLNSGIALFFRRHRSPFTTMQARLKVIKPGKQYDVSLSCGYSQGEIKRMTGKELASIIITISEQPGSVLLRYGEIVM